MCSIMGCCGNEMDLETFMTRFRRAISRGPDCSRVVETGNGFLGFHRLSIMGLTPAGMQPFELDGRYATCNVVFASEPKNLVGLVRTIAPFRGLFEKHCPGQDTMVKGFWMPNRSWPGCGVNDPSARVLPNYGKSGE